MKRVMKILIGFSLLGIGLVLIVLPGPAFLVLIAGLATLASEFVWAEKLLSYLKKKAQSAKERITKGHTKNRSNQEPPHSS